MLRCVLRDGTIHFLEQSLQLSLCTAKQPFSHSTLVFLQPGQCLKAGTPTVPLHIPPSNLHRHPSAIPHWCYCNQVNVSFYFAMLLLFCNGAMFLLFCNGAMFLLFCNGTLLFCNGTIPHCCTCNQVNVCKLLIQACFKRVLLLFCIGTLQPFHTAVLATRSMFASCSYKPVLKECSFYFALIQHCDGS